MLATASMPVYATQKIIATSCLSILPFPFRSNNFFILLSSSCNSFDNFCSCLDDYTVSNATISLVY